MPAQTDVAVDAAIVTDGVTAAFTTMVVWADVAVLDDLQVAVDVMITSTLSPFASVADVYVAPVAPVTFVPLSLH